VRGLLDAHVVNVDDRRMREFADDAGFSKEVRAGITAGELRRKEFDGDKAVDERIVRADHTAVRAGAQSFENFVATDLQG